jgi:hypothetical protein
MIAAGRPSSRVARAPSVTRLDGSAQCRSSAPSTSGPSSASSSARSANASTARNCGPGSLVTGTGLRGPPSPMASSSPIAARRGSSADLVQPTSRRPARTAGSAPARPPGPPPPAGRGRAPPSVRPRAAASCRCRPRHRPARWPGGRMPPGRWRRPGPRSRPGDADARRHRLGPDADLITGRPRAVSCHGRARQADGQVPVRSRVTALPGQQSSYSTCFGPAGQAFIVCFRVHLPDVVGGDLSRDVRMHDLLLVTPARYERGNVIGVTRRSHVGWNLCRDGGSTMVPTGLVPGVQGWLDSQRAAAAGDRERGAGRSGWWRSPPTAGRRHCRRPPPTGSRARPGPPGRRRC